MNNIESQKNKIDIILEKKRGLDNTIQEYEKRIDEKLASLAESEIISKEFNPQSFETIISEISIPDEHYLAGIDISDDNALDQAVLNLKPFSGNNLAFNGDQLADVSCPQPILPENFDLEDDDELPTLSKILGRNPDKRIVKDPPKPEFDFSNTLAFSSFEKNPQSEEASTASKPETVVTKNMETASKGFPTISNGEKEPFKMNLEDFVVKTSPSIESFIAVPPPERDPVSINISPKGNFKTSEIKTPTAPIEVPLKINLEISEKEFKPASVPRMQKEDPNSETLKMENSPIFIDIPPKPESKTFVKETSTDSVKIPPETPVEMVPPIASVEIPPKANPEISKKKTSETSIDVPLKISSNTKDPPLSSVPPKKRVWEEVFEDKPPEPKSEISKKLLEKEPLEPKPQKQKTDKNTYTPFPMKALVPPTLFFVLGIIALGGFLILFSQNFSFVDYSVLFILFTCLIFTIALPYSASVFIMILLFCSYVALTLISIFYLGVPFELYQVGWVIIIPLVLWSSALLVLKIRNCFFQKKALEGELASYEKLDESPGLTLEKAYYKDLKYAMERANKGETILVLEMMCIPHLETLKSINGSRIWDEILYKTLNIIKKNCFNTHLIYILDGHIFSVLMENTSMKNQLMINDGIIEAFNAMISEYDAIDVSVTLDIASVPFSREIKNPFDYRALALRLLKK